MKQHLIETHLITRRIIDKIAVKLEILPIGSRESILKEISRKSYGELKKAINVNQTSIIRSWNVSDCLYRLKSCISKLNISIFLNQGSKS